MSSDETTYINALVPKDLRERLELSARRSNRSLSGELRHAIKLYLENEDDVAGALARYRLSLDSSQSITGAEVHERAEQILAAAGKPPGTYSAEDYSKALEEAQRDLDDAA